MNTDIISDITKSFESAPKADNAFSGIDRVEALKIFTRLGFPHAKNEEWKYTNISRLVNAKPSFESQKQTSHLTKET